MASKINSTDLGPIWLQSGNGVPDHLGIKGTVFIDLDNTNQYINKDGLVYWDRFLTSTSGGTDTFVTGMTFNNGNYNLNIIRNDGVSFTQNLGILSSDMTVTGGTYNINTGIVTFTNNSGGTFDVTGFTSGMTDSYTTGTTISGNVISYNNNLQGSNFYSTDLSPIINPKFDKSGGTISGNINIVGGLSAITISGTTYQNLPLDISVTGGTFNNFTDTITFTNNTGGTFNVTGLTDYYTTGTTRIDDILYFNRNDSLSSYTSNVGLSADNNRLLVNDSSTGVISFSGLSFQPSGITFNVGAIKCWFIDNESNPFLPTKIYSEFSASTGNTLLNLSGQNVTYIAIDSGGTISQQGMPFQPTQFRTIIPLGVIVHSNRLFINGVNNQPIVSINPANQVSDLITNFGVFNVYGNIFGPNGVNLSINKTQGEIFKQGVNFVTDSKDPHTLTLNSLIAPNDIRYRIQTSVEYGDTQFVDPNNYDNNGVLSVVPDTKYTVQRIYLFQSNLIRIQYGQFFYDSLDDAKSSIVKDSYNVEQNLLENGLLRGFLVVRKNTTDLTDTNHTKFIECSKFGTAIETNTGTGLFRGEILNNSSTGLLSGGIMTISSSSTIDIAVGNGIVIDNTSYPNNPILTEVFWNNFTGVTITNLTGQSSTAIFINANGNIVQQDGNTLPSAIDIRDKILLGLVGHPTGIVINIFNTPTVIINPISQINDLSGAIGPFSISGNKLNKITGTLKLFKTTGKSFFANNNYHNDRTNPSIIITNIFSGGTLNYVKQNGFLGPVSSDIDTINYDNNGTITPLPSNDFAAHRIWYQPTNNIIFFQYGQINYPNINDARSKFESENFIVPSPLEYGAFLIGVILVRNGETNLDNPVYAEIIQQGKFAGTGGGGSNVDTLQSVYDNSVSPEILTNSSKGALSIKNGAGTIDSSTIIFEGISSGNTITSKIYSNGSAFLSGRTLIGTSTDDGVTALQTMSNTSTTTSRGLKVMNNGLNPKFEVRGDNHIDFFRDTNTDHLYEGTFIHGASTSFGSNISNRGLINFINYSNATNLVTGIQGGSGNYGNIRSGMYFVGGTAIRFSVNATGPGLTNVMYLQNSITTGQTMVNIGSETSIASTKLNVSSTVLGSSPFPRMTSTERNAITTPIEGLYVYQTNGVIGLYQYTSSGWRLIPIVSGTTSQFLKGDGSLDSTSYQTLLTNPITGLGTVASGGTEGYLSKFTGNTAIGNSVIYEKNTNILIGTTTQQSSGTGKLIVSKDTNGVGGPDASIQILGSTNSNNLLGLGYDTTNKLGYIQAQESTVAYKPLALNANGGNVLIGTKIDSGDKLQVVGSLARSGVVNVPLISTSTEVREYTETILRTGSGVTLAIPFISQTSLHCHTIIEVDGANATNTSNINRDFSFKGATYTLNSTGTWSEYYKYGNISSISFSGLNLIITFTNPYTENGTVVNNGISLTLKITTNFLAGSVNFIGITL
jgi:hypothetical protein